jgi:excisionase family DNA binding protein
MPMPDLTVAEVATRLNVTSLRVRSWLRLGSLVGVACDDRAACRIRETDLAAFLDARHRGGAQAWPRHPAPVV